MLPRPGDYFCRFVRAGQEEPRAPCRITEQAGRSTLETLAGARRIHGTFQGLDSRSFRLQGTQSCTHEQCTRDIAVDFESVDFGIYRGPLRTAAGVVWMNLEYLPGGLGSLALPAPAAGP